MTVQLSVDRVENGTAVLIDSDGGLFYFPRNFLPEGTKAGDVLTLTLEKDIAVTEEVADETRAVQDDLKRGDPGGDLAL